MRNRLYWYSWKNVEVQTDLSPWLEDVIEDGFVDRPKSYCIDANYHKGSNPRSYAKGRRQIVFLDQESLDTFTEKRGETKTDEINFRILTPEECERLQTIPVGYTDFVSKSKRYQAIGNGWTIHVVATILCGLRKLEEKMSSNLPPGVTDGMLPGNRIEDIEWENFIEELDEIATRERFTIEEMRLVLKLGIASFRFGEYMKASQQTEEPYE